MADLWGHVTGLGFIPKLASPALILVLPKELLVS